MISSATFSAFFSVALALVSTAAFAGVSSSGGGFAVVCRTADGAIRRAELLDLYEAEKVLNLKLRRSHGNLISDVIAYRRVYSAVTGEMPAHYPNEFWTKHLEFYFSQITSFTAPGTKVPETNDHGSVPALPKNCRLEQVAIFYDRQVHLLIDTEIWNAFGPLHQAALLAHEDMYRDYRRLGQRSSSVVRRSVGYLFSTTPPDSSVRTLQEISGTCRVRHMHHGDSEFTFTTPTVKSSRAYIKFDRILGLLPLYRVVATPPPWFSPLRTTNSVAMSTPIAPEGQRSFRVPVVEGPLQGFSLTLRDIGQKMLELQVHDADGFLLETSNQVSCHRR